MVGTFEKNKQLFAFFGVRVSKAGGVLFPMIFNRTVDIRGKILPTQTATGWSNVFIDIDPIATR